MIRRNKLTVFPDWDTTNYISCYGRIIEIIIVPVSAGSDYI